MRSVFVQAIFIKRIETRIFINITYNILSDIRYILSDIRYILSDIFLMLINQLFSFIQ
jgi:hypothetical protein